MFAIAVATPVSCGGSRPPTSASTASDAYAIRLHHPARVGDRTHVLVVADHHGRTRTTVDGVAQPEEVKTSHTELDAVERVVEVDTLGRAVRAELTVTRLTRSESNGALATILDGDRPLVIATARDRAHATVLVGGVPATAAQRQAVDDVVTLTISGDSTDDDIFGTPTPQSIGASWSIDAARAARSFHEDAGMDATFAGTSRLVRRLDVGGVPSLEVVTNMTATIASFPNLPDSMTMKSSHLLFSGRTVVPIDSAKPRLEESSEMNLDFVIGGTSNGKALELTSSTKESKRSTATPM